MELNQFWHNNLISYEFIWFCLSTRLYTAKKAYFKLARMPHKCLSNWQDKRARLNEKIEGNGLAWVSDKSGKKGDF